MASDTSPLTVLDIIDQASRHRLFNIYIVDRKEAYHKLIRAGKRFLYMCYDFRVDSPEGGACPDLADLEKVYEEYLGDVGKKFLAEKYFKLTDDAKRGDRVIVSLLMKAARGTPHSAMFSLTPAEFAKLEYLGTRPEKVEFNPWFRNSVIGYIVEETCLPVLMEPSGVKALKGMSSKKEYMDLFVAEDTCYFKPQSFNPVDMRKMFRRYVVPMQAETHILRTCQEIIASKKIAVVFTYFNYLEPYYMVLGCEIGENGATFTFYPSPWDKTTEEPRVIKMAFKETLDA